MFGHIYFYRLKCIFRDRQMMFWTFLFPLILATFFQLSLSNITKSEAFKEIKIAVAVSQALNNNSDFKSVLNSVSKGENRLFDIEYTSSQNANELLKEGKISGYIYYDKEIRLAVKSNGLNQTIIKAFLDDYRQTSSSLQNILSKNPNALQNGIINDVYKRQDFLSEKAAGKDKPETTVHYFYTLIGMTCLYGAFLGLKEVMAIQANQTTQGARVSIAPTHKMRVFSVSVLAAVTVLLLEITVLLLYLAFGLKVNLGDNILFIALTCIVGSFTGVTFGTLIASVIKKGEGLKIAILTGGSMTLSFLSGMMQAGIKQVIQDNVPVLALLNPANLISDSFYSLYYYSSYTQYFINLALLCGFALVFSLITFVILRRQKYASL